MYYYFSLRGVIMKTLSFVLLGVCAVLSFTQTTHAGVLAIWNFGDSSAYYTENPAYYNTVTAPMFQITGGEIDTNGKNGTPYIDAAGVEHIAGQAAAWDDIKKTGTGDAAILITLDAAGFSNLAIRWDYNSEKATSFDFSYRLAPDAAWTSLHNNYAITAVWGTWYSVQIDLSGISEFNNASFIQFQIDDLKEGPGNDRFALDNLEITGVPEPTTLVLLGVGAVLLKRSKRSA